MNCLEFRRQRLIDPLRSDEAQNHHEAGCDACRRFAGQTRQLEDALRAAVVAIDPPEAFEARALLGHILKTGEAVSRRRILLRIGGGVLGLGMVGALAHNVLRRPLSAEIVAHAKPEDFQVERGASEEQVAHVLGNIGHDSPDSTLSVLYASNCTIGHHLAAHLVLDHNGRSVNVFLMPMIAAASREFFRTDGYTGEIRAFGGGSVAIVAQGAEHLEPTYETVAAALAHQER